MMTSQLRDTVFTVMVFLSLFVLPVTAELHGADEAVSTTPTDIWNDKIGLIILSAILLISTLVFLWFLLWQVRKGRK